MHNSSRSYGQAVMMHLGCQFKGVLGESHIHPNNAIYSHARLIVYLDVEVASHLYTQPLAESRLIGGVLQQRGFTARVSPEPTVLLNMCQK